ncbi:peptidoglycan-recognition protein SB2-like isoform X2 [Galleria mellonella]|uniref:Peptidoglycan-recognition protein SB2-like isoform X2 n=1 Tax=Galleria mellonella TaxID=7137 RepID=A0ABM3MM84_GALME|nr:peptidoglycan-recognition protein SB2-like isoform X2 [Galleria mellonella]
MSGFLTIHLDHESRHNLHRIDNEERERASEDTPLLQRFPQITNLDRNPVTTAIVSLLLIILIAGVIIGIYLLILQNNSENILPPVDTPLQIVNRLQWDRGEELSLSSQQFRAKELIVVQTDSDQCYIVDSCIMLLRNMQATRGERSLPYNFLLSSNGEIYEALGWHSPSPLFPEYNSTALVLAFIGNFTEVTPNSVQIEQTKNFIAASLSGQHLDPSFEMFGKKTKEIPKYLILSLETLPRWSSVLSDT